MPIDLGQGGRGRIADKAAHDAWMASEPRGSDGRRFHDREPPHYLDNDERTARLKWLEANPDLIDARANLRRIEADAAAHHAKQGPGYNAPVIGGSTVGSGSGPIQSQEAQSQAVQPASPAPKKSWWRRLVDWLKGD